MRISTPLSGLLLVLAGSFLLSCAPRLDGAGDVRLTTALSTSGLQSVAGTMRGLRLSFDGARGSWLAGLGRTEGGELLYIEWGGDLFDPAARRLLADLAPWEPRLASPGLLLRGARAARNLLPPHSLDSLADAPADTRASFRFLPASGFPWGLFSNRAALATLHGIPSPDPSGWKDLAGALAAIKASGLQPIALGAANGWPALAWISYLDLRMNGAELHRALLEGRRGFDDPSLAPVFALLGTWRDAAYFGSSAGETTWVDAAKAVAEGRAALVLLGAGLRDRFADAEVAFSPVPPLSGGQGPRGELATLWGFALSKSARAPEAALALADAFVKATRDEAGLVAADGPYRRPLVSGRGGGKGKAQAEGTAEGSTDPATRSADAELETFRSVEDGILTAADLLLPPLDKALSRQAAYEAGLAASAFFAKGSRMTGTELAQRLAALVPAAKR